MSPNQRYPVRTSVSLFTREWIEIPKLSAYTLDAMPSPSLRGSGLKYWQICRPVYQSPSPSLRGSGLKLQGNPRKAKHHRVSLFTREWIEILL